MEIEQIRQELNHLLDSVVEHSENYSNKRQIPSLEIGVVLAKINKMQENLAVLRYLLRDKERQLNSEQNKSKKEEASPIIEQKREVEDVLTSDISVDTKDSTVVENLQQNSIHKLVDAFNLNDRYLYANELFNKDMNAFNELIKLIDNSSSIEDAQIFISKAKEKFSWDKENQLTLDFISLIERRFI